MGEIFNGVMRAVSSLIGLAMMAMGGIWMLQGLDLAFRVGFMVGHRQWVLYGALLALVGICQIIWSNTRGHYHARKGSRATGAAAPNDAG
jgi:hypothetical protein